MQKSIRCDSDRNVRGIVCSGPVDVGQTMFVNHTSTVTCMEGCDHQFLVEPRDTYGNLCVSTQSLHHGKFNITLTEVSANSNQ